MGSAAKQLTAMVAASTNNAGNHHTQQQHFAELCK
jgi:hypothetical protein